MPASFANSPVRERLLALTQLVGSMICLQFGSSLAKSLFPLFGAAGMVGLRTAFAATALMLFFRSWHAISRRTVRLVLLRRCHCRDEPVLLSGAGTYSTRHDRRH
nr:hypothetical protein [Acetobacter persici]